MLAASSLTEAFQEIAVAFEREHPGIEVDLNLAASSHLAVQILEGAPADVFASADEVQMNVVDVEGLVEERDRLATSGLVIITPADDPAGISAAEDLTEHGVKVVLAQRDVPAGRYATQALDLLGLLDRVRSNVVSEEQDVKEVVTKVALGEVDAGIVYRTDVTDEVRDALRTIELPPRGQVEVVYAIATMLDRPHPASADLFYDFVLSPEGLAILESYGFGSP